MSTEAKDNGKETVDLVWSKRPKKDILQRKGRGPRGKQIVSHSLIPRILRDIGPEHPIDFHVKWKSEEAEEAAKAAADIASAATGGGGRSVGLGTAATMKLENTKRIEEEKFGTDNERIAYKSHEGISELIKIRKFMNTSKGALKLLIEILRLSVAQGDRPSAYDLLWAIEESSALKEYEEMLNNTSGAAAAATGGGGGASDGTSTSEVDERYKALVAAAKKMKQAQLANECSIRGLDKGGSKDDLLKRLRGAYQLEARAPAIPTASGEEGAKKSKDDKKGKDKKAPKEKKADKVAAAATAAADKPPLSDESLLIESAYEMILKVRAWRSGEPDMIRKQLTEMSHLLPPLSPFTSNFKLDDWQKRVLKLIDQEKSVLICAPTSSGKTVLSSYVASKGRQERVTTTNEKRPAAAAVPDEEDCDSGEDEPLEHGGNSILFIVPSDPLVWQVGAHFAKWQGLDRNVALITDRLSYAPHIDPGKPAAVVVGTPLALENALTKMRGKSGSHLEEQGKLDLSQLIGGFDHYRWVVYDEVHSIGSDTPDGMALQRLIKALKCKFLALSATVGNANELRTWMERVKGEQVDADAVTITPDLEVKMEVHEGRFINLQRHLWTPVTAGSRLIDGSVAGIDGKMDLVPLHPLSAVSAAFLQDGGFGRSSLPMTPQDSYTLWENMTKFYDMAAIEHLDPHTFFADKLRITLLDTKDYEMHMKSGLEALVHSHPAETRALLDSFTVSDMPPEFNIYDLVQKLRVKDVAGNDKLPAIVFHLDIVHLIGRFKELLYGLESAQRAEHGSYYATLEMNKQFADRVKTTALDGCSNDKEKEDLLRETESVGTVDTEAPHPDFVLNAKSPISRTEYEDICKDVAHTDFRRDLVACKAHPLMRALRRGIGLYIDEVAFQAYKRAVMRLATKGKLAVVFSDESLAFGVNMPFRTCVFCGDMGGRLNSTLVQQMSGRAGRRGLDTQGHLVYAGAKADFVQRMVISVIPALEGTDPRYLTMFLQDMSSRFSNPRTFQGQMSVMGQTPLQEHIKVPSAPFNMHTVSRDLLLELELIEECDVLDEAAAEAFDFSIRSFDNEATPHGYKPRPPYNASVLWLVWDLRDRLAESVAIAKFLPLFFRDFCSNRMSNYGESEDVQFEFCASLLQVLDRRPVIPDGISMNDIDFINSTTVVKRQELRTRIETMRREIAEHNAHIHELHASGHFPTVNKLLLPVDDPGAALDGTLLHCFISGQTNDVPVQHKHEIKERLWTLGCVFRSMHNALWPDKGKYGKLATILRKCFMRIQYIAGDHIKDAIHFVNISSYELEGSNVTQICSAIESNISHSLSFRH